MFQTFRDAFKTPDLRAKLLFTLAMLFVIRIGATIGIPGIDPGYLQMLFSQAGDMGQLLDMMSGGAFQNMKIFAMGIIPYINSSIIMNLLTIAIPALEEMQKEGAEGRKKIAKYTRYLTVALALIQSTAISIGLRSIFENPSVGSIIVAVLTMTAGTAFLMWIGERITENGVGNGISLIIFVNIISRLKAGLSALGNMIGQNQYISVVAILLLFLAMVVVVVLIYSGERRISVQYAKRVQGRKVYGGQSTHIPIKVNMAGVIPVIFASSLLQFPSIVTQFFTQSPSGWWANVLNFMNYRSGTGAVMYFALILAFAFFYTAIIFNPFEVANNMKKNGGFIPGIRPGKPTVEYLTAVLNRMVLIGGTFLGLLAIAPIILGWAINQNIGFSGTSLIIVVGVCLETVKQIESQLVMRHYKGFLNA